VAEVMGWLNGGAGTRTFRKVRQNPSKDFGPMPTRVHPALLGE
jgi:hypothetical protein